MLRRSRSRLAIYAGVCLRPAGQASTSAAASTVITAGRSAAGVSGGTPMQVTGTRLTAAQENALAAAVKAAA